MPRFNLNIKFDSSDLQTIVKAGQKVTLVKQNKQGSNLAWVAFQPFENNTLEWETNYAVYCSNQELQSGVQINKLSDIMATPALKYIFKDGAFTADNNSGDIFRTDSYYVKNEMAGYDSLTFGLAQGIYVNGKAVPNRPINAVTVPFMHNISFSPLEIVNVYLEADIKESMVITNVNTTPLQLTFGNGVDTINIKYNKNSGTFFAV